ncbi:PIN domain-containing protein [Rubrivirga sp.]|uniref:PIN domain-containing protein n=1 Tax=Rubrivirga sp. TaxID=1885344 RepID=UPI003B51EEF1
MTRTALDTSVLVAALERGHERHETARPYLRAGRDGDRALVVSSHALAETFATLTALPLAPRIPPRKALRLLDESVLSVAEVVALDGDDYRAVLARLADLDLTSGAVYDALHVQAAEKAGADELVTINGRDFRRMPPQLPCRLVVL